MKGRLAIFCVAFLGCDDAVGIEIRVPDSLAGVDTVELVIGVGPSCLTPESGDHEICSGIAPPADPSFPPGKGFPSEVYRIDAEKSFIAPVSGGVAKFRLEPESTTLPAVIAVGTGGGLLGTVILDDIELGAGAHTYAAELVPAGDTLVDTSDPTATNVQRWEAGTSRCIGAEVVDTGRRVFIVPEEDPDCDAVATECDPLVHLAADAPATVDVDALTCTSTRTLEDGLEPSCLLGAPICDESAEPDSVGCANASEVCISDHVCACNALDAACMQTVYATDSLDPPTLIHCAMQVVDNGGANLAPCNPQALIGPVLAQVVGGTCSSGATIGPVGFPLGPFGISHAITLPVDHQLVLTLHDPSGSECRMQVDWAGSFDAASGVQKLATLVKLDLGASRSMIVPLVIEPVVVQGTGNCTGIAGNRCDLVRSTSDQVFGCVPP